MVSRWRANPLFGRALLRLALFPVRLWLIAPRCPGSQRRARVRRSHGQSGRFVHWGQWPGQPFIITDVRWDQVDAPQWITFEAMRTLSLLDVRYRENGYALALHGSVLLSGKDNDLDLIAVPMEVAVTPPAEMGSIMCELLDATAVR